MKIKLSFFIMLSSFVLTAIILVSPSPTYATSTTIDPSFGRVQFDTNIEDLTDFSAIEVKYHDGIDYKFALMFEHIPDNVTSAYLVFDSHPILVEDFSEGLTITLADNIWPTSDLPVSHPSGATITKSKPIYDGLPLDIHDPYGMYRYRIDVTSLLASSSLATDHKLSLIFSGHIKTDILFVDSYLEVEYDANTAPDIEAISDKSVDEESELTFQVEANDAQGDPLTYSLINAPDGAVINATGVFSWTPTENQDGTHTMRVRVSDGELYAEEQFTVTVYEVNVAPVLAPIGNKVVDEESLLSFIVSATDIDLPANILTYSLVGAPTGAIINAYTGEFSWTPTEAQGPGIYPITIVVSDGNLTDGEHITVTVNEVNAAPVLAPIGDKSVTELSELSFMATASDADSETLVFGLVDEPAGASINATTGVFSWTPSEAQGPGVFTFKVVVSDGSLSDEEEVTVTVNEVNTPPVLDPIGDKTVDVETLLTFTATANDVDLPANTLTYRLEDAPVGASMNASTGEFSWTPSEAQGSGTYAFKVVVSDGMDSAEEEITVTVNAVNAAPVLDPIGDKSVDELSELSFTATASDTDSTTLIFILVDAPTGASINATTGEFSWTPSEAQGPGEYTFKVVVSDGSLSDEEEVTVTVNEVNTAPVIDDIADQEVDEGNPLTFTVNATDVDLPSNTLSYSLVDAPTGASINASSGVISWTPSEAQGPGEFTFKVVVSDGTVSVEQEITVTVREVNTPPVLDPIGDKTVDEQTLLTFTATAHDVDLPANTLTYSLVDAPSGASIDASSGVFSWTPSETQGPGEFTFKVVVHDGMDSAEEEITVTVNEVNAAPVLSVISDQQVTVGSVLAFTVSASDHDEPSNTLTYQLIDAPDGATINSETGRFNWTPTSSQGGQAYTFKVRVSDGTLTDEQELRVRVNYRSPSFVALPIDKPETVGMGVLVNGKSQNIGTVTTAENNGQQMITITLDAQKLEQLFEAEGENAVITMLVSGDHDVAVGKLSGRVVQKLIEQHAVIVIQTENAAYELPAEQIDLTSIAEQFGDQVDLKELEINIEIAQPLQSVNEAVEEAVENNGQLLVMPPLSFKVSVHYDGKTIEITRFNSYVKRTITIPTEIDPTRITTAVVVEEDGTIRQVPTRIIEQDQSHVAIIHSLTNSTYALIWNPVQFVDVENHWAKDAINNMGSRLIINGKSNGAYDPNQDITRADFAAIVVRGLGLRMSASDSAFTDVKESDWYHGVIQTAYEYGLINGYADGTFRPNDSITREQVMLIISKAMQITKLQGVTEHERASDIIGGFADAGTVSGWAIDGVADSVRAGIITGRNNQWLAPKANMTRAEVASIIERLLQKSNLID